MIREGEEQGGALDPYGAFIERIAPDAEASGRDAPGVAPLAGMRLAVKDLFDIGGRVTGFGSPAWASESAPARQTAPAAQALIDAGALFVGKTHLDELAYSLAGDNAHYGAPINPAAPGRATGGSSSGSAAAVAGGLAEIGLGSDTGGSVRLPAAYCGLFGLRPTHGRVSLEGARPLAPSYDVAGWFARDAETLARAGRALGFGAAPTLGSVRLILPLELWAGAAPEVVDAAAASLRALEALYGPAAPLRLTEEGEALERWREIFRVTQAAEIWEAHGAWIRAARPAFGPGVKQRFAAAEALQASEIAEARAAREGVAVRLEALFAPENQSVAVFPTTPTPAPKRDAGAASVDAIRARSLAMLCPAGIAGLPQLSLPSGLVNGAPVGLSLMGPRGADEGLLAMAEALSAAR
ncbi:MAG: amidase [Pseudomonadota bacterium]